MKISCIKEEQREDVLLEILSLCETYIAYLDGKDWDSLYYSNRDVATFILEKLVGIINQRFLAQLHALCLYDEELQKLVEDSYAITLYQNDFHEIFKSKIERYGLIDSGEDLLYFYNSAGRGLTISENDEWFSFFEEEARMIGYYDEEEWMLKYSYKKGEVYSHFFPMMASKAPELVDYYKDFEETLCDTSAQENDTYFVLQSCPGLFRFQKWLEEDGSRYEEPQVKSLLHLKKKFENPFTEFGRDNYHYIETPKGIYRIIAYAYDGYMQCSYDGKFLYPNHFFVMVAIEVLLKLIGIKHGVSFL